MLKTTLALISMLTPTISWGYFHYPEDRVYNKDDKGYTQYGAPSLHKTGRYALTFDDGPHDANTELILDYLAVHDAKATFFIITSKLNPKTIPIVKRMIKEGHIVASHGRTHDNSNQISKAAWKSQVKQSFLDLAKIYREVGEPFTKFYYRFPYAAYGERNDYHHLNALKDVSKELMGKNCIHFAFWDVDSGDWIPGMKGSDVFQNLKASNEGGKFITYKTVKGKILQVPTSISQPTSGGVVLQHDIQFGTIEATKNFLKYAKEHNLEIVPLSDVDEFKITKDCILK